MKKRGSLWWQTRKHKSINKYDAIRQRNHQFYISNKWRKIRLLVLSEFPVCQDCGINASEHVHHQLPLHTKEGWMNRLNIFDENDNQNLFGLCFSCHSKRTALENLEKKKQAIADRMNELNDF